MGGCRDADGARRLARDKPYVSKEPGTAVHTYLFAGKAGSLVDLSLRQEGVDLTLTLEAVDGTPLATRDGLSGKYGTETLCLVLPATGTYTVSLSAFDPDHRGHYVLTRRHATPARVRASERGHRALAAAAAGSTDADHLLYEAEDAWRKADDAEQAGQILLHRVDLARRTRRPEDALALLDQAVVAFHNQPALRALTLQRKAVVLYGLGRLDPAIAHLEAVLALRKDPGEDRASALEALAKCYNFSGASYRARSLLLEAQQMLNAPHQRARRASILAALGWNDHGVGNYISALACYRRAAGLLQDAHPRIGFRLNIYRARTHIALEEPNTALARLAVAETQIPVDDPSAMAHTLAVTRAEALLVLRRYEEAAALLRAPAAAKAETAPADFAHIAYLAARADWGSGHAEAAAHHILQALAAADAVQTQGLPYALRADYEGQRRRYADFYIELLADTEPPPAETAWRFSEQRRLRGLPPWPDDGDPAGAIVKNKLRDTADQISAHILRNGRRFASPELDDLLHTYDGLLFAAAAQADPPHAVSPPDLQMVRTRLLDAETSLMVFALGETRLFAWVVTTTSVHLLDLGPRRTLAHIVGDYREAVGENDPEAQTRARPAAEYLSRRLFGEAWQWLQGSRLLLVPDGDLFNLPFAALPQPGNGGDEAPPLAARFEIALSASLEEALADHPTTQTDSGAPSALVLAAPDFGAAHGALPGTTEELAALERMAARRDLSLTVLTGPTARKAPLLEAASRGPTYLHLATHGIYFAPRPALSSLVLTSDPSVPGDSGLLYPADINGLHLNTRLVVLSACATALGKNQRLQGRDGFAGAFLRAGARGVVASLWRIDDAAAAAFMDTFYEGLWMEGLAPTQALRRAQLRMREDARFQAPYFWAGFTYRGKMRP